MFQPPRVTRRAHANRRLVAAAAVALGAGLVAACTSSTAPAATPTTGVHVDTRTPPGLRAQQALDMLNSDWQIRPESVATLATPDQVPAVVETMSSLWWDRPYTLDGADVHVGSATLHLTASYGAHQDVEIRTGDDGLVNLFEVTTEDPQIGSWSDLDETLNRSGARYSYQAAKVGDGHCEPVAGANTGESLPLASIFKLYVLYAVADAVKSGSLSWDDELTVTEHIKAVGMSSPDEPGVGAQVSVRSAAEKMIAVSDNVATDLLIDRVGTRAVERALVDAGHHDPASMTPFPTMYEIFSIGWGKPDLREQWQNGSRQERNDLLKQADSRPYQPDPARTRTPASSYGVEWFGSAEDICRVHTALQVGAVGAAEPVKQIMSTVAGVELDRTQWPYIGAKGGGLPGDLTFSWYAVHSDGQPWVLSLQFNWPRDHGPQAAGWLHRVATQTFALLR